MEERTLKLDVSALVSRVVSEECYIRPLSHVTLFMSTRLVWVLVAHSICTALQPDLHDRRNMIVVHDLWSWPSCVVTLWQTRELTTTALAMVMAIQPILSSYSSTSHIVTSNWYGHVRGISWCFSTTLRNTTSHTAHQLAVDDNLADVVTSAGPTERDSDDKGITYLVLCMLTGTSVPVSISHCNVQSLLQITSQGWYLR